MDRQTKPDLPNAAGMAFGFMSILPAPQRKEWSDTDFGYAAVFYPLVGAAIGCIAGAAYDLLERLTWFGTEGRALFALLVWVVLSGGLHLDGLADCMDGFLWSGEDKAKRLSIMKDPTHGTYAVLGLFFALALKWAAIANSPALYRPLWFAFIGAAARWAMLSLIRVPSVNPTGMAAMLQKHCPKNVLLLALPVPLILLAVCGWLTRDWTRIVLSVLLTAGVPWAWGRIAKKKLGGINGDVLGACIELTELALLIGVSIP